MVVSPSSPSMSSPKVTGETIVTVLAAISTTGSFHPVGFCVTVKLSIRLDEKRTTASSPACMNTAGTSNSSVPLTLSLLHDTASAATPSTRDTSPANPFIYILFRFVKSLQRYQKAGYILLRLPKYFDRERLLLPVIKRHGGQISMYSRKIGTKTAPSAPEGRSDRSGCTAEASAAPGSTRSTAAGHCAARSK